MRAEETQASSREPQALAVASGVVFLISLAVYTATLSRTVQWGDSGELTAAAYVLGVPHAPGYPLLMLLAKMASLVPLGSVAARLNLLNAILAAGAASLTTIVARRLGCGWLGMALAGLTLALSPIFWSQAVAFEVYSLAALMLAILLLLALRWAESRRQSDLFLLAFVYGLATSVHLLLVAFAPAFAAFCWVVSRRPSAASVRDQHAVPRPSPLIPLPWAVGGLLLGAAIWLYLPFRASAEPPVDFGHPTTWANFLQVVTGGPGRAKLFGNRLEDISAQLASLLNVTVQAFYWPGIILALLGAGRLAAQRREALLLTGLVVVINFFLAANVPVIDVRVYLIPAHLVLALWLGLGVDWLWSALYSGRTPLKSRVSASLRKPMVCWGSGALLLLLPWAQVWDNWPRVDMRKDREASLFAHNLLDSVEPGALVVTDWWYVGPLLYARFVEGRRSDVQVVPQLSKADPSERLALFTEEVVKSRAVYAAEYLTDCIRYLRERFLLLPIGRIGQTAYRVLQEDAPLPLGSEHPALEVNWKVAAGWELVGFDLPLTRVQQGRMARLVCHWRATSGSVAPEVLVALDAVGGQQRLWRRRSTLVQVVSQRSLSGEQLLFREEFIAWLPSDAPPGTYRFAIEARKGPADQVKRISPEGLSIQVLAWHNQG